MPINESDVKRQRKQHERQFEPTHDDKWGTLVTVNNSINPPGRPNWNWVDMFGLGTSVVPVINETMLQKPGTPVQIGNDPRPPGLRVIGPYTKAESPVSQVDFGRFNTGPHAQSHQYMSETVIGDDVAKIYQPALQPLKTTGDGTTLITITQPLIYNHGGLPKRFPGAPLDHTASVPATTGHARRVLVYLDEVSQTIATIQGESVLDNGAIPIPYPEAPADSRISAYIKLSQGQTGISTANHIEDSRDWLGKGVTHFRHLADVDFSAAADGFVPTYDEDTGLIIMAAPAAGGGTPGGSDGQVQYNNGGAFGGAAGLVWDDVNVRLEVNDQLRVLADGYTSLGYTVPAVVVGSTTSTGLFTGTTAPGLFVVNRQIGTASIARSGVVAGDGTVYGYLVADELGAGLANSALPAAALGLVARTNHPLIFATNNVEQMRIAANGTVSLTVDLPVTEGGTGASTAADARTNLGAVNIAGDTMIGPLIINATDPQLELRGTNVQMTLGTSGAYGYVLADSGGVEWQSAGSLVFLGASGSSIQMIIDATDVLFANESRYTIGIPTKIGGAGTPITTLEVAGTDGAFLPPRLTTTQRDALTPTAGMQIYNSTLNKMQAYENTSWVSLSDGGGGTPGGSDGQVQYNDGGAFGGASGLFYDDANNRVGIGTSVPDYRLVVRHDAEGTSGGTPDPRIGAIILNNQKVTNPTAGNVALMRYTFISDGSVGGGVQTSGELGYFGYASSVDSGTTMFVSNRTLADTAGISFFTRDGTHGFHFKGSGRFGLKQATPQGLIHGYDGTGGFLHWTRTGISTTAITIIPDGTGDVTNGIFTIYSARHSGGNGSTSSVVLIPGSDSTILTDGGSSELRLRCNANGSVDIRRVGGSGTFNVSLWLLWM